LVAGFALGAMTAPSAFAAEYGVCITGTKGASTYTDKNCTKLASPANTGSYNWSPYPGPPGTSWTFKAGSKNSTLAISGAGDVRCKKTKTTGTVTGANTTTDVITFEQCTDRVFGENPCWNVEATKEGRKGGTIVAELNDKLIAQGEHGSGGGEPGGGEVWTQFEGNGGPYSIILYCSTQGFAGTPEIATYGSAAGMERHDVNVMSSKGEVALGAATGEQDLFYNLYDAPFDEALGEPFTWEETQKIKHAKYEIKAA